MNLKDKVIRLEKFSENDFEKLISWISNEEDLIQFAGSIFSFPLTKEQLNNYIQTPEVNAYKAIYNNISGSSDNRTKLEIASDVDNIKGDFNLNFVLSKWPGFVKSVANEKALILGQFIHTVRPVSLEGNQLFISSTDSHVKDLLKTYGDYFSKKSNDYFGKRIKFNYKESETKSNANKEKIITEKSDSFEKNN